MIRKYIHQSFTLLKQNVLFSSFYIIGTGLAISMVMILATLYYIKVGDIYPESHRSRMLIAPSAHMQKIEDNGWNNTWKYSAAFVKECFYSLIDSRCSHIAWQRQGLDGTKYLFHL